MEGGRGGLTGDQWPKGLTEEQVRKIAKEEAMNALAVLKDHIANTPQRSDGNLNARDFHTSMELAGTQLNSELENSV